jgi:hypothetical protein
MAIPDLAAISKNFRRILLGVVLSALVCASTWLGLRLSNANATPPAPAPDAAAAAAVDSAATAPVVAAVPAGPMPTTVEITFTTYPPTHAIVAWGKTILGRIKPHEPLVVVRPRDSGPLDVIVRAGGYMPVHTRAHTFADSKIGVKLTRPDKKDTLFGYRAPIDAGPPDAGQPPATTPEETVQQPPP